MPQRLSIPDLAGKKVLVTGASTGIGAAVARALGEQGAHVAVHYHASREAAEAVARDIAAMGVKAPLIAGNVSDAGATARLIDEAAEALGGLDGLINNAGGMLGRVALADITDEHYEAVTKLNSQSVLVATRAAVPHLKKAGGGFIINTTSIAARTGGASGAVLYAAAKAFVSALTHGLAKELIGLNIRVNAVSPGVIATPFHERYSTPEQMRAAVAGIPQGRVGTAEECVGTYLFLASEALSSYVVGQVVEVNGGQYMP
jgi:3-oxoacyl-[acyl-carrier protein] reductase